MNLETGALISDRYRIINKIGVGGMAVVYRAKDEKLDRDVTFKVLKEEFVNDNEFIKRFSVEARAAARLSHVNIVNVYDVGNDGDIYYIVMEYIDGYTLKEMISKKAPFDNQEALGVAIQIASALEHAHNNNIIHRDIKPQNILVTRDERGGKIKVTDFGIARATTSTTTTTDSMGSVHYFSPEQARGGFVDAKSDIYSLGIVIFEMVTGIMPFDGDNPVALAMQHINEPLPDIKRLNPKASDSIVQIILKATEKLSSNRYQTIEDMNNDLKRALTNTSGDFVKRNELAMDNSPTVAISQEDLAAIRQNSGGDKKHKPKEIIIGDIDEIDDEEISDNEYLNDKDEEYYDKRKERNTIIAAIVTAIAIIAILTAIGAYFVNGAKTAVVVPEFVGMVIDDAERLAELNNVFVVQETEYNDETAEGMVISQSVDKGKKIKKSDKVTLVVSLGSQLVEVPDVVNIIEDAAEKQLAEAGFELEDTEYEYSDTVEAGLVCRQSPEAKEEVKPGSTIKLYVSLGDDGATETVPGVENMPKDKATETLEEKGFEVKIIESYSASVEAGNVIDQGVKAGAEVPKGYVVTLTVSKGKDPNEVQEKPTEVTTERVITTPEVAKKIVSIPVNPALEGIGDEDVLIKLVAKDSDSTRVVLEKYFKKADFPFTVNDQIDEDTSYELYINNKMEYTQSAKY